MPKSSLVTRVAKCGHEYVWYTFVKKVRPHCPDCMPAVREQIKQANAERRAMLARAGARTGFHISKAARGAIYERDGWVCQLCLDPVDSALPPNDMWSASLDHIVCQSWAGQPDHSPSNLRLAHRWCNSVRGNEVKWTADDLLPSLGGVG